jgi:hypothetical protein
MSTKTANRLAIILVAILALCTVVGLSSCSEASARYSFEYSLNDSIVRVQSYYTPVVREYDSITEYVIYKPHRVGGFDVHFINAPVGKQLPKVIINHNLR